MSRRLLGARLATPTPARRKPRIVDQVRGNPADGGSLAHGRVANAVWNADSATADPR